MKNFNKLTPAETERLAILSEECAEVIHIIGKIVRHGYESCHPSGSPTNRESLEIEIGHVNFIQHFMIQKKDINMTMICQSLTEKSSKIQKYLHHQG